MDKTLLKGLRLLETLVRSPGPRGVSELSQEVGLTRSNTHRTLQTLVAAGYVRQDRSASYECTLKLLELSQAILGRVDVAQVAQLTLQELAAQTQETVHLSVLDGIEVVYLQRIDSPQPVRAHTPLGARAPAYCVATGKALLAFQDEAYLARLEGRLERYSSRTIVAKEALSDELRQVRRQGYAINRGEWRESVGGIAAVIYDATGRPVAGIGVSGPLARLRTARLRELSGIVTAAARQVSRALGYSGPHTANA